MSVVDNAALFQSFELPEVSGKFQAEIVLAIPLEAYGDGIGVTLEHVEVPQLCQVYVVAFDRVLSVLELQGMPAGRRAHRQLLALLPAEELLNGQLGRVFFVCPRQVRVIIILVLSVS